MAHAAGAVAGDLHLDMACARNQLLDENVAIAERAARLRLAARKRLLDFFDARHRAHPAPAASRHRLDHDRTAGTQRREEFLRLVEAGRTRRSRQNRHARTLRQQARLHLVAEQLQDFRPRPDEAQPFLGASMSEFRVLAEKAVARMYRVAPGGGFRDRNDLFEVEICGSTGPAQRPRLVGLARVQRIRVILGIDRDGADPEFGGGAHYPNRDFTAVGDQQARRHHQYKSHSLGFLKVLRSSQNPFPSS